MGLIKVDTVRFRPTQRDRSTEHCLHSKYVIYAGTVYRGEIRIYTVRLFRPPLHKAGPLGRDTVEILTTAYALVPCAVQLLLIRIYTVRLNHTRSMS